MTTREAVYRLLSEADGAFVSGEVMAEKLGVSRMAISKAVKGLQGEGLPVEAQKRCGYRLAKEEDVLSKATLAAAFGDSPVTIYYLDETDSTNRDAKVLALDGPETPYVVVSSRQKGGRGRLGRTFESPNGGVYFSLVLSGSEVFSPDLVTVSVAYALAIALERLTGIETSIKWVNDIYIRGKKAVGILTEGIVNMEEGGLSKVVIGCGINLKTRVDEFSPELRGIVTSFYPGGEGPVTRAEVIAECVKEIMKVQKEDFLTGYREKCFVPGHHVTVVKGDLRREAEALEIDEKGHLVVRYEDGAEEALSSGEVSIRL